MNEDSAILYFYLDLTHDEVLGYYKGHYRSIRTLTVDDVRIEFPVTAIKPFIMENGIHGLFSIEFDSNNKLLAVKKVSSSSD